MGYEILQINSSNIISNKAFGIDNTFNKNGVFRPLYRDIDQAYANLKQLLLTVPGERFYHPTYGCALLTVVYEPNTYELKEDIITLISDAINSWLPYITINSIDITTAEDDPTNPYTVHIVLKTELGGINLQDITVFVNQDGILTLK
jgi:phage baseplate assembly protein W